MTCNGPLGSEIADFRTPGAALARGLRWDLAPLILGFLGLVFTAVGGGAIIAFMRSTDRAPLPRPAAASDAEHPAPS